MKQDTWNRLDQMFANAPMMKASGVSYEEIDETTSKEGFVLPESYREFIHRYGGATVGPYSVIGLRAADTMGGEEISVFDITRRFRTDGWSGTENWLIFSTDLAGNPIGFDQDGVVWISDHGNGSVDKIAKDFESYILEICLGVDNAQEGNQAI